MDFPKLSAKEYIILDLLRAGQERFGLEMVKESQGNLKRGTIYVTLNRMDEKGYVESKQEKAPNDPGMPRRVYTITGEGLRALRCADAASIAAAEFNGGGASYA